MQLKNLIILSLGMLLWGCGSGSASQKGSDSTATADPAAAQAPAFDADSAYAYVERQVKFGPRVPNTDAHRRAGEWIAAELRRHGADVTEQRATLTAFDSTPLKALNIFGRFNPDASERTLLLAHWDSRPWADKDADEANRRKPVDGANDGASGVGVILELARQMNLSGSNVGLDILFVDAEDWGDEGSEDSWALGARHFMENIADVAGEGYMPAQAILLDMVGSKSASFPVEYFSNEAAPELVAKIWSTAKALGYGDLFPYHMGSAVTDDHVQLIDHGIPTVDIIDYRPEGGFDPVWHTSADNMENISAETLGAVGRTVRAVVGF